MADGIREAYADLFRINKNAHTMSVPEVKNKMKTLSEGSFTDRVLSQMAGTFATLVKSANFSSPTPDGAVPSLDGRPQVSPDLTEQLAVQQPNPRVTQPEPLGARFGLIYNVNIHLPESRDRAVYDACSRL